MPLRNRIFIVITVIVLAILGLSIILLVSSKKTKDKAGELATSTIQTGAGATGADSDVLQFVDSSGNVVATSGYTVQPLTSAEAQQVGAKQIARIFIERYGSYSTDNKQQNIKEVKSLVTVSLWSELSSKIGTASQGGFVGVTTKVITTKITDWSDTSATAKLSATREVTENGQTKTTQQNVTVYLVKTGSDWLVNKFVWE